MNKTSTIFKHIAKGRNANNTFAKSLKCSLFGFAHVTQLKKTFKENWGFAPTSFKCNYSNNIKSRK